MSVSQVSHSPMWERANSAKFPSPVLETTDSLLGEAKNVDWQRAERNKNMSSLWVPMDRVKKTLSWRLSELSPHLLKCRPTQNAVALYVNFCFFSFKVTWENKW